jgi:hypothetical protein
MTNDQAERLIAAVERLAAAAESLVQGQQRKTSSPAKFIKPIDEFPNFDWGSIGAKVEYRDSDRIVAAVSWRGFTYERKQKHGDIWFSRNAGKDDEGNPVYETLIKFAANVAPNSLPTSMVRAFEQPSTFNLQPSTFNLQPSHATPATAVQPQPQHPQHNALIKSIRTMTGHSPEQIVDWCSSHGANSPAELSPLQCEELAEALALGWGKGKFPSDQNALTSYQGHVKTRVAAGVSLSDAIASWISSVTVAR